MKRVTMGIALCLCLLAAVAMAGTPHIAYGKLSSADLSAPAEEQITFSAFFTVRPEEQLNQLSTGCRYEAGYWVVAVGNFPSRWAPGDTLCVDVVNTGNGQVGRVRVVMTNSGSDRATDLLLHFLLPEIEIHGQGQVIENNDVTPSWVDHTDFDSVLVMTEFIEYTFAIVNRGNRVLHLTGMPIVSLTGAHAEDFKVTQEPAASIALGDSTVFMIGFTPTAFGVRTALVIIANDDSDENPYQFAIQGRGFVQIPEIEIRGLGGSIANNDVIPSLFDDTDFDSALVMTGWVEHTFTLVNHGKGVLKLLAIPAVSLTGAHADDFKVTQEPAASIAPDDSTVFMIGFSPTAVGVRIALVSIANDDSDENPYQFAIQGRGFIQIPGIEVSGHGLAIANHDLTPAILDGTDFDSVQTAFSMKEQTFSLKNRGTGELKLTGNPLISISGEQAGDFAIIQEPAASIAAWDSTTFTVRFKPLSSGLRNAMLTILSNDDDENPYLFSICGFGWNYPLAIGVQNIEVPSCFELMQNYPNPFNPTTSIVYQLPEKTQVLLVVFDLTGREMRRLVDRVQNAGCYSVLFNATNLASGTYVYRLKAGAYESTRIMTLVR